MLSKVIFLAINVVVVFGDLDGLLLLKELKLQKQKMHSKTNKMETRFDVPHDVDLLLYTRRNPTVPEILSQDIESLENSNYDIHKSTQIVVHGWRGDIESQANVAIRQALLEEREANFIYLDWGKGADLEYVAAVENAPKVGKYLGNFIDWLIEHGTLISNIHLIGHSIGAHVAAIAGRQVTRGIIPYIAGLDPAGILWGIESERIQQSDAEYVEIIHTETIIVGTIDALGHVDFYPNGGTFMPGCNIDFACSHERAILYFANSIDHKGFMGIKCSNQSEVSNATCTGPEYLHMGGLKSKQMSGIFYLKTSDREPFYLDPKT